MLTELDIVRRMESARRAIHVIRTDIVILDNLWILVKYGINTLALTTCELVDPGVVGVCGFG
jgi:hypothetical protein